MSTPSALHLQPVRRVRDADGGYCPTWDQLWTECCSDLWPWRHSQLMHERGTGHQTVLVRFDWQPT